MLVVGMHPAHDGLRVTARALGHLRGAAFLCNVVEGQSALTGAHMGGTQGQTPQVFRCLTPAGTINA